MAYLVIALHFSLDGIALPKFSVQVWVPCTFLELLCMLLPPGTASHSVLRLTGVAFHFASAAVTAGRHRRCSPPRKKSDCISLRDPVCAPVVLAIDWQLSLRSQVCSAGKF